MLDSDFVEYLEEQVDEARYHEQKIGMQLDTFLMQTAGKSFREFHPSDVDAAITGDVSPLYPDASSASGGGWGVP